MTSLSAETVDSYLQRLGIPRPASDLKLDFATLATLQRAHMTAVPFENLDVMARTGVRTELAWSIPKIIERRRGGWCFEVNGAFGALLGSLGFDVSYLGAAVLLNGPNSTIDHLMLEVQLEEPWLVDVGFGEGFIRPLALTTANPQDGGDGTYQFLTSPHGTTLAKLDDGVPAAHYRFKRVVHQLSQFDPASDRLQTDPTSPFVEKPFATRLLDGGPERVTLLQNRLRFLSADGWREERVRPEAWGETLVTWFGFDPPGELGVR